MRHLCIYIVVHKNKLKKSYIKYHNNKKLDYGTHSARILIN